MDIANFAHDLSIYNLSTEMRGLLRRSFLDTIGVAAIGTTSEMSQITTQVAPQLFGTSGPAARMLFAGGQVSAAGSAFQGAFTVDSIDAHDSISLNKGHAGSAVFPAMLGLADVFRAEGRPVDGAQFMAWCAVGYEISGRAGQAQHATVPDYHTSGSWTAVGVAAAAARALGCTPDQIRHAAGIGEYHGPRSQMMRCIDHPTMVRDGVGWGSPSGVSAAYMAQAGFTGAPALTWEGPQAAPYWADLGHHWHTVTYTSYKPYPCCRWAHPAIDGVRALMVEHGLHHEQVAGVEIRTFHNATRLAGQAPKDASEFAYSIAFPVATMIVRGQIGVPELHDATLSDPDILRISHATQLIDDPELTRRSETGVRFAQVTLILTDGTRLEDVERTPRGDPQLPMSDAEIEQKYHLFSDPVLGKARADRIKEAIASIENLSKEAFSALLDDIFNPLH